MPAIRPLHTVLYDDECPLCVFQMKLLTWLDFRHVLRLLPLSNPRARAIAPGIEREDLLEAIHCVTAEGQIYKGARAFRFIGLHLPLLLPLSGILYIPGVIGIAEQVYQVISRNRLVLSRLFGCKGACAVMPQRKRDGDSLA